MIKKALALLILAAFPLLGAAQDNNWKLLETTTFGAGGFWENGQTVRIDRSFRAGVFSYERKVTSGQSLSVFSSKGTFSSLKDEYAPGESLSVTVSVTGSGSQSAAPDHVYGRVTLLQGDPGWTRENWSSHKIAAAGSVAGQLTSSGGSFIASPDGYESLTLAGKIPATGNRMAIVFSCNGMDVIHLYGREGAAAQETADADTPAKKGGKATKTTEAADQSEPAAETAQEDDQPAKPGLLSGLKAKLAKDKPEGDEAESGEKAKLELTPLAPRMKLLVLGVLLLAAIFDLLYMFSKPKK